MIPSSTTPTILPAASILQVFGRTYDESVSLTSKYNQSLLRDRRGRVSTIVDNQTGTRQMNSSLNYRRTDRIDVKRSDQICAYLRRPYIRQATRYNPYMLSSPVEQKMPKVETHDVISSSEEKPVETINHDPVLLNDDQVVIAEDVSLTSKATRRRLNNNTVCPHCKLKFKTKQLLNMHLSMCHNDVERSEPITRRQTSKNESLLVSLLKQEPSLEKPEIHSTRITLPPIPSSLDKDAMEFDEVVTSDLKKIESKLEKYDEDFFVRKSKGAKKTATKTQTNPPIAPQMKVIPSIFCIICGESNIPNDTLVRCSTCEKSMHGYRCLNFKNKTILKIIKTYPWQCSDCKKCIQCGTVEHDDELLFCDHCDRAYHMDCLDPPLSEAPPGEWYCQSYLPTRRKMIERCLYVFPLSVCILVPLAYFLSFLIAVELGHSKFEFPFISRSSTDSPESCIYSQIINIASFVLTITVYIRHRQIAELIRNNPTCGIKYSQSNLAFLICGIMAALGMSVISNFPHTNVFSVRLLATYLTFAASVGALYCEMLLSMWIRPLLYSSRILPIIRTLLTIVCTLALFAFIIFQTITVIKYDNEKKIWTPSSPGWNYHLSSIASAWILTSCLLIYMLTLIVDFRSIKIISPKIFLTDDITDDRD